MGCWLETCFVSHLPIGYGEPCRLFFLEHHIGWRGDRVSAGFSYTTDVWAPCSFALRGKYNDYGAVEGIDPKSLEARLALEHFRERLLEQASEEDKRRRVAVTREGLTLALMQDHVHEGRARFKGYDGQVLPYGMVFVREDVYKAFLRKGYSCDWRTPKRFTVARFERQGHALVAAIRACTEKWLTTVEFLEYEGKEQEYDFARFVDRNVMEFRLHLTRILIETARKGTQADVDRLVRLIAEHLMFATHLDQLRRSWMPQAGKGSQDDSYDVHAWFAGLVGGIASREHAREE